MLSDLDALTYKDQLHPAYAGYLHDGEITNRDVLGALFHLMKTGVIFPIFQDNNMTKVIIGFRRTKKEPYYVFERQICQILFNKSLEIAIKNVKVAILSGSIQAILEKNIDSISTFPLVNKKLKFILGKSGEANFNINGRPVTDIKIAGEFKNALTKIIMPIFLLIGVMFFGIYFFGEHTINNLVSTGSITIQSNGNSEFMQKNIFLFMGLMFTSIPLLMYSLFTYSNKVYSYNFKDKIVPFTKERYKELFEFIKTKPLSKHNFNNEFLPYSIAFGLDNSWNKDFGIETEIKIDETSMTK